MTQYPALTAYSRVITTKRPAACHTCGTPTREGTDLAAVTAAGKWHAYCTACAGSYAAQVSGLVKRCTDAEGDAPEEQRALVVLPDEATMLAVLDGSATDAQGYDTVVKLLAALAVLSVRPVVVDPANADRIGKARAIANDPNASPRDRSFAASLVEQFDRKGSLSDKQWACVDRMRSTSATTVAVEPGLYLQPATGDIFKAYITQNDRLGVKKLHVVQTGTDAEGAPTYNGSFDFLKGGTRILGNLLGDGEARVLTQEEAKAFGRQHAFCCNCARDLEDDRSLAAGYGPTCASNLGWWYPTPTEAAEILGRPAPQRVRGNTMNEIIRNTHRSDCD